MCVASWHRVKYSFLTYSNIFTQTFFPFIYRDSIKEHLAIFILTVLLCIGTMSLKWIFSKLRGELKIATPWPVNFTFLFSSDVHLFSITLHTLHVTNKLHYHWTWPKMSYPIKLTLLCHVLGQLDTVFSRLLELLRTCTKKRENTV